MRRPLLPALLVVGATTLLAGCGGSSSTTSATDWASSYCSAATTWVSALERQRTAARAGSTSPSDAAQAVTTETDDFRQAIDGLARPDTPDGSTSESTANDLATSLQGRVRGISAAASTNDPHGTVARRKKAVDDRIAAAFSDVAATTGQLETNDAELGTAIRASPDCAKLDAALSGAS